MTEANITSWCEPGLFPLNCLRTIEEVKRYHVKEQKKEGKEKMEMMAELVHTLVKEQINKKEKMEQEQEERSEEWKTISFGTKQARVLTSPESLARLRLWKEWIRVKN